jgi:hypothetical protein
MEPKSAPAANVKGPQRPLHVLPPPPLAPGPPGLTGVDSSLRDRIVASAVQGTEYAFCKGAGVLRCLTAEGTLQRVQAHLSIAGGRAARPLAWAAAAAGCAAPPPGCFHCSAPLKSSRLTGLRRSIPRVQVHLKAVNAMPVGDVTHGAESFFKLLIELADAPGEPVPQRLDGRAGGDTQPECARLFGLVADPGHLVAGPGHSFSQNTQQCWKTWFWPRSSNLQRSACHESVAPPCRLATHTPTAGGLEVGRDACLLQQKVLESELGTHECLWLILPLQIGH